MRESLREDITSTESIDARFVKVFLVIYDINFCSDGLSVTWLHQILVSEPKSMHLEDSLRKMTKNNKLTNV